MRFVLATANLHKLAEVRRILPQATVLTPEDLGIRFDYDEKGSTFLENSYGKAEDLFRRLEFLGRREIVIADDSGICVNALGGAPGVLTARFGSPDGITKLPARERNAYLLQQLANADDRGAHYVCAMTAVVDKDRFFVAQEIWKGEIAGEPSAGVHGFGYDPVFLVPERGVTAADLSDDEKDRISHRGLALRSIAASLELAGAIVPE